jgi:NTP pyrophosphatase (non-canonical NTP hydrolase)
MNINNLIRASHGMAAGNGFWDEERNVSEMLMLIVSEVAEAQEALRKNFNADKFMVHDLSHDLDLNNQDEEFTYDVEDWKQHFEKHIKSSFEDELADVAIRLFDLCGGLNIDLEKHIALKMHYNSTRPRKHGKAF